MTQSFSDLLLYIYPLKDKINFCSCSNCITSATAVLYLVRSYSYWAVCPSKLEHHRKMEGHEKPRHDWLLKIGRNICEQSYWNSVEQAIIRSASPMGNAHTHTLTFSRFIAEMSSTLKVLRYLLNKGPLSFSVAGPTTWNLLPRHLRDATV